MFGFVTANIRELTKEQQSRYGAVYCGICRSIRQRGGQLARLGLSFDMAFLALLLMSLYEPAETTGDRACILHPLRKRAWVDNEYVRYAADMNIALGYYKADDDVRDDHKLSARMMAAVYSKSLAQIQTLWPRQCGAISRCITRLEELERDNCPNPDLCAACFGDLMAELLVYREDFWAPTLRALGHGLGRFIYLLDAMVDYRRDQQQEKYNPFLAMGTEADLTRWEQYLTQEMAVCTEQFRILPLIQDAALLECILYSGVWIEFERLRPKKSRALEERT